VPTASVVVALVVASAATVAFALNEWTQGGVSDALRLGHHHLTRWSTSACDGGHAMGGACNAGITRSQGAWRAP